MIKYAKISDCENYRYQLARIWDETKPFCLFVMLNPSVADSIIDDRTIRRCINFAKSWGYGGLYVGNLFAYRSTKPENLYSAEDPEGIENNYHLSEMGLVCKTVVCAWGNSKIVKDLLEKKGRKPLSNFSAWNELRYIDLANDGTPKHPLYLKGDLQLKSFV